MYSRCIFCHHPLGRNEVVETFPVGRRLACDSAKGRLWVVCSRCERWNLSALEERWEALETCERLYRDSRLRVATENIGLCRLHEGLELVRIGRPLRPEFAAWRYGDQFGRRRRRHALQAGMGLGLVGAVLAGGWVIGASLVGASYYLFEMARASVRGLPETVVTSLPLEGGRSMYVVRKDLAHLDLLPASEAPGPGGGPPWHLRLWKKGEPHDFVGEQALSAAGRLLPHLNRYGGSSRQVQEAVRFLERLRHPLDAFDAVAASMVRNVPTGDDEKYRLSGVRPELRLALEMAAHEEAERRALEGELALLERTWREAEEIAAIADSLAVSSTVERWLRRLKGGIHGGSAT